ncbi:hypothetical protein J3R82DRAFT_1664 [Butyriboletus roseoflavus]|nr:hypothetical protein J3R82DRAFT_1664 [Butyriboletus roseoflavus]
MNIRNGDGLGGGCIVGFLPIMHTSRLFIKLTLTMDWSFEQVPNDSGEDSKLSYTNLKRIIWHQYGVHCCILACGIHIQMFQ